jgi:hypothetical protein
MLHWARLAAPSRPEHILRKWPTAVLGQMPAACASSPWRSAVSSVVQGGAASSEWWPSNCPLTCQAEQFENQPIYPQVFYMRIAWTRPGTPLYDAARPMCLWLHALSVAQGVCALAMTSHSQREAVPFCNCIKQRWCRLVFDS